MTRLALLLGFGLWAIAPVALANPTTQCQQQARAQGFIVLQTQTTDPIRLKTWRRGQTQTLACTVTPTGTVSLANPEPTITDRLWQLHGEANPPITLELRDGRISGSGGCNRYMGSYTLTDTSFSIRGVASTRRACPPPVLDRETQFLIALSQAQRLRLQGNELLMDVANQPNPLRFHAQ